MRKLIFILFIAACAHANLMAQARPVSEWVEDINTLRTEIPKRYAGFFERYPEAAWNDNLDRLIEGLQPASDLWIGLQVQSVLARAHDAYLRADLTKQLQADRVIPVGFGWYADGLFVSGTIHRFENTLGKKVLAINGKDPGEVLEKVGMFVSHENETGLRKDAVQWLRFPMVLRMAGVTQKDTMLLTMENANGDREEIPIYPINFRQMSRTDLQPAQITQSNPDLRWQPVTGMYRLEYNEEENLVYFQYNYCASQEMAAANGDSIAASQLPPFQPFADSIISVLESYPGSKFFFDLRFNPGGNPADGIALANHLSSIVKKHAGDRLFVAINQYSAAAPIQIADAFRRKTRATILGTPSSEYPNHDGSNNFLVLPNTQIQVYYPVNRPLPSSFSPNAFLPDVEVDIRFSDFIQGNDPVLDKVRDWGKEK